MKRTLSKLAGAVLAAVTMATPCYAEEAKAQAADTAHPGGKLSGNVAVQLVEVAGKFVDPIHVASAHDGSGRLFVCERPGKIKIIGKDGKTVAEPFYDNQANTSFQFLENGLYCVEFHPKFKENGLVYISYADMWFNGATMIVEYKVSANDPNKVDMATARPILRIDYPYCNHHGGKIKFGPDGMLYIGVGDGGWEGDVLNAGQDLSNWWGKMLRIDVSKSSPPHRYVIPETNPFVKAVELQLMVLFGKSEADFSKIKQNAKPEIWCYGVRNPWTFSFDKKTGDLFMSDVGQNQWELVLMQPAGSKGGENYGWPLRDGTHPFPIEDEAKGVKAANVGVMPIAEYSHATDGICVAGFGVYRGSEFPSLEGTYFLGDWGSGRVWGLKRDDAGKWQMQELLHTALNLSCGGEDDEGNLYACNMGSQYGTWNPFDSTRGSVWKLVAADKVPAGAKTAPAATAK